MIVDTGASTDILDEDTFRQINHNNDIVLQPTTKRLFAYGSTDQLPMMGQFNGTISFRGNQHGVTIHILKGSHGSLLCYKTATTLGILDLQIQHVQDRTSLHDKLSMKYPTLFQGIGKLKDVASFPGSCAGEEEREPGTHCSRMRQVPLVTCILLRYTKITVNFCLPPERSHCMVILPVGHIRAVLKSKTISL